MGVPLQRWREAGAKTGPERVDRPPAVADRRGRSWSGNVMATGPGRTGQA